jgi:hypothetical protein
MRARRLLTVAVVALMTSVALVGCASPKPSATATFESLTAVNMLPPTKIVDSTLGTTMVFTQVPIQSVQTKAGTVPAGECGAAITAFADAKSKDNAYEEMSDASGAQIQFNAVRYTSLAIAKAAFAGYEKIADVCPHASDSGISAYSTGIDGASGWLSDGRHSAGFLVRDTMFYLNTSLSGEDTAKVIRAELAYARTLVKPG